MDMSFKVKLLSEITVNAFPKEEFEFFTVISLTFKSLALI